jgi:hypothetical protein
VIGWGVNGGCPSSKEVIDPFIDHEGNKNNDISNEVGIIINIVPPGYYLKLILANRYKRKKGEIEQPEYFIKRIGPGVGENEIRRNADIQVKSVDDIIFSSSLPLVP